MGEGRIAEQATELVLPRLAPGEAVPTTIVVGTIAGDHHGLGRRVLAAFLRSAGYRVVDVGLNAEAKTFVDTAIAEGGGFILGHQNEIPMAVRDEVLLAITSAARKWGSYASAS